MTEAAQLHPAVSIALIAGVLVGGAYVVRAAAVATAALASGTGLAPRQALTAPVAELYHLVRQQRVRTEHPDDVTWWLAPAGLMAMAAAAMSVVPLAEGVVVADVRTGIVVFGAAEALVIVAVFLHGWSPNSPLPLIAGYRFVAVALSYELLSMFVLIGAALPAESLSFVAIVDSQRGLWNVVRQPLGLPLWIIVSLGVTFRGPLDIVDATDLAGGGSAEDSGAQRVAWSAARHALLAVFAIAGAAVFLGGWHGPLLPGPVWMALKSLGLIGLLVWIGETVARIPAERFVPLAWTVLLPLAFADLVIAGLEAL
ncbi:MAG: complex I subunit 1 family protein [Ilumatobacteraceae bacterium]